ARPPPASDTCSSRRVRARARPPGCAAVLPVARPREGDNLSPLEPAPPLPTRTAALLTRKGAYRSVAARAFIERARAYRVASAA
ncbi:transcriptional regulator CynR, partial [Burkholderia pseudomultivorans]|nr:transcriptional regulator CynR [Burkholderia pseudomultivorans]